MSAFTGAMAQIMQTIFVAGLLRDPAAAQGFMEFQHAVQRDL